MADDTKTSEEMIYEVASILGKAVAGEALGQPEKETIDGNIDPVLAEVEEIVYIGDRDAIPVKYFQTLARLIAVHSAAKFSNAPVDIQEVYKHEDRLRYLAKQGGTGQVMQGQYF